MISVDRASDLRHTRTKINKLAEDVTNGNTEADSNKPRLGREWSSRPSGVVQRQAVVAAKRRVGGQPFGQFWQAKQLQSGC